MQHLFLFFFSFLCLLYAISYRATIDCSFHFTQRETRYWYARKNFHLPSFFFVTEAKKSVKAEQHSDIRNPTSCSAYLFGFRDLPRTRGPTTTTYSRYRLILLLHAILPRYIYLHKVYRVLMKRGRRKTFIFSVYFRISHIFVCVFFFRSGKALCLTIIPHDENITI